MFSICLTRLRIHNIMSATNVFGKWRKIAILNNTNFNKTKVGDNIKFEVNAVFYMITPDFLLLQDNINLYKIRN